MADFEIIGAINDVQIIACGTGIREPGQLNRQYGRGNWRKQKGSAMMRLANGRVRKAELHWCEAHGIGRREMKRKLYLD